MALVSAFEDVPAAPFLKVASKATMTGFGRMDVRCLPPLPLTTCRYPPAVQVFRLQGRHLRYTQFRPGYLPGNHHVLKRSVILDLAVASSRASSSPLASPNIKSESRTGGFILPVRFHSLTFKDRCAAARSNLMQVFLTFMSLGIMMSTRMLDLTLSIFSEACEKMSLYMTPQIDSLYENVHIHGIRQNSSKLCRL